MKSKSENLKKQYQLRFSKQQEYRDQVWQVLCSDYFSRFIAEDAVVLDLGAGWGEFVNHIVAAKKYAMDLNPAALNHLASDVIFINQDCSQTWNIESESLDVIFTSNFLEHLSDRRQIEFTIFEAHRCLKKGGIIICLGPNIRYVHGAYWDFWDHVVPITDLSCAEVLSLGNFTVEECFPKFLPYSMSQGKSPSLNLVRLYLRFPLLWHFFGKQFLVVGKKAQLV